jgi:large subunit ribosomal protein L25
MATSELTLTIESRSKVGTTSAHQLRVAGKVPGIIYGHGATPEHIAFDRRAFELLLHAGARTGVVKLTGASKGAETVLIRDVQRDPVSQRIIHADLQRVSAHESVHAKLQVVTLGTSRGVRESGAVMDVITHEVEVEGPVDRLPDRIEIDVAELGVHDHVTAGDIVLPDGFKMLTSPETTILSIEPSRTAQAVEDAATAATLEQPEPEVIGAKPAEEGATPKV